jgi:hypothetical protein
MHRSASVRASAIALSFVLLTPACSNVPAPDPTLSPAENELRREDARFNNTTTEGAVFGAALGAATGLAVGLLTNQKPAGVLALTAGGAVAGGALGTGAGYMVARNNYQAQQSEANLQKAIAAAQQDLVAYQHSARASFEIAQEA